MSNFSGEADILFTSQRVHGKKQPGAAGLRYRLPCNWLAVYITTDGAILWWWVEQRGCDITDCWSFFVIRWYFAHAVDDDDDDDDNNYNNNNNKPVHNNNNYYY